MSIKRDPVNHTIVDNSKTFGLQAPRLTRQELTASTATYGTEQNGDLVYITDVSLGNQLGQRINIGSIGYYYFDGTANVWQKIQTSIDANTNIYSNNGSLTGNRTVTQAANTLSFTATSTNAFSVDGSTFSVDAAGDKIGIGTTAPAQKLDVNGIIKSKGLTNGNTAIGSSSDFGIYNSTNTWLRLATRGNDNGESGTSKIAFYTNATEASPIGVGSVPAMVVDGGKVGIGTSAPSKALHINGEVRIEDGSQGTDKILRSDANGNASWFTPSYVRPAVLGDFSAADESVVSTGGSEKKYSKVSMKLTKGKYVVNAGLTFYSKVTVPTRFWLNMYLSSSSSSQQFIGFKHLGPAGNNVSYAGVVHVLGSNIDRNNDANLSYISGSSIIEVTNDEVTLFILVDDEKPDYWQLRGKAWENYFYAVPLN